MAEAAKHKLSLIVAIQPPSNGELRHAVGGGQDRLRAVIRTGLIRLENESDDQV